MNSGEHHYFFAHYMLRDEVFGDPGGFFTLMTSPLGQGHLESLWRLACFRFGKSEGSSVNPEDFHIHQDAVDGNPALIIILPEARSVAEAHMVCAVLMTWIQHPEEKPPNQKARYFTLEKGVDHAGGDRTVFCEWTEEEHINYGDGPAPNAEAFRDAVERLIRLSEDGKPGEP